MGKNKAMGGPPVKTLFAKRLSVVYLLLILYTVVLVGRLFTIQVINGNKYREKVLRQSAVRLVVTGLRGEIVDRFGRVMARSIPKKVAVAQKDDSLRISKTSRLYPNGAVAGQVLGVTGLDGNGLAGIEYKYEVDLKGKPGSLQQQRDGKNRKYKRAGDFGRDSLMGSTVKLTLDMELQEIVEQVLAETVTKYQAKSAMAVVMNPQNGEIYAIASVPNYNPNYGFPADRTAALLMPVSLNYEPGSTFKAITLAAALDTKTVSPDDSLNANFGRYEINGEIIRDSHEYGMLSLEEAFAFSSNVCFAKIADKLGPAKLYRYIRDFGFGSQTSIDFPGEERGIVHPVRTWSGRTAVTVAFGHEITATLLQVVTAYCAIANGGHLLRPQIIYSITDSEGVETKKSKKEVVRRVISPETALTMRTMMRAVVDYGTASKINVGPIMLAGKTGTSEKIDPVTGGYDRSKVWASFVGMAPVDNPAIVIGVVVDEPMNAMAGGQVAGPAVAEILKRTIVTPNMTLGGRLVGNEPIRASNDAPKAKSVHFPQIVHEKREKVQEVCARLSIPVTFIGDGPIVTHQSPAAGSKVIDGTPLLAYTTSSLGGAQGTTRVVPNCVGLTMKDALNALSIKGLTPHFKGRGKVVGQTPYAGTVVQINEVCTLYCETSAQRVAKQRIEVAKSVDSLLYDSSVVTDSVITEDQLPQEGLIIDSAEKEDTVVAPKAKPTTTTKKPEVAQPKAITQKKVGKP